MNDLKLALRAVSPIVVTYIFLGTACGIFYVESGLSPIHVLFASIFIYSGSMTFVLGPLLVQGASLFLIGLTTLFVNGRHLFYGVANLEKYQANNFVETMYLALTLTDEVYSIEASPVYGKRVTNIRLYNLLVHFFAHGTWILGSMMGALAGDIFPVDLAGIDFSGTAFFIIVVLDQFMTKTSNLPLAVGLGAGLGSLLVFGPDNFILMAMIISIVIIGVFGKKKGIEEEPWHE